MNRRIRLLGLLLSSAAFAAGSAGAIAPVDEPGVCLECHADIGALDSARHRHTVFADGRCSACHNPHASRHAALLGEEPARLCARCHDDIAAADPAAPHAPVREGACGSCHDPHASDHPDQLRRATADLCASCHPVAAGWTERPHPHAPVADGDCGACHAPHGSAYPGILVRDVPGLCFTCHDGGAGFAGTHQGRDLSASDCTTCHAPHAAELPGLLRENRHAPFAGGNCKTCHGDPAPDAGFAIAGDGRALCLRCHRGVQADLETDYNGHLDHESSCTDCHAPHAADGAGLLSAPQGVLCMRCHFEGTAEKPKAMYATHDGMDCTECHVPHGSPETAFLTADAVAACADCHVAAHRSSHPVGPDVIDERTGEPVTCLSCHQLHGADFPQYLPLDPNMDLCVTCHKK